MNYFKHHARIERNVQRSTAEQPGTDARNRPKTLCRCSQYGGKIDAAASRTVRPNNSLNVSRAFRGIQLDCTWQLYGSRGLTAARSFAPGLIATSVDRQSVSWFLGKLQTKFCIGFSSGYCPSYPDALNHTKQNRLLDWLLCLTRVICHMTYEGEP